jgi:hypothetical protein
MILSMILLKVKQPTKDSDIYEDDDANEEEELMDQVAVAVTPKDSFDANDGPSNEENTPFEDQKNYVEMRKPKREDRVFEV